MTSRGFGALPDTKDSRDSLYLSSDLVGSTAQSAQSLDMIPLVYRDPVMGWPDQLQTKSCVGYAICQAIWVASKRLGIQGIEFGSPVATYFHAVARRVGWNKFTDDGSSPRNAWESLRQIGLVPFRVWPGKNKMSNWNQVAQSVGTQPSPDCYRQSIDFSFIRYLWIQSFGLQRKNEIQQAITSGLPVALTLSLDDTFGAWKPGDIPWNRKADIIGLHHVCAVGYEKAGLWIANSWGGGFGENGLALISWDTISSEETSSIAIPDFSLFEEV